MIPLNLVPIGRMGLDAVKTITTCGFAGIFYADRDCSALGIGERNGSFKQFVDLACALAVKID